MHSKWRPFFFYFYRTTILGIVFFVLLPDLFWMKVVEIFDFFCVIWFVPLFFQKEQPWDTISTTRILLCIGKTFFIFIKILHAFMIYFSIKNFWFFVIIIFFIFIVSFWYIILFSVCFVEFYYYFHIVDCDLDFFQLIQSLNCIHNNKNSLFRLFLLFFKFDHFNLHL